MFLHRNTNTLHAIATTALAGQKDALLACDGRSGILVFAVNHKDRAKDL